MIIIIECRQQRSVQKALPGCRFLEWSPPPHTKQRRPSPPQSGPKVNNLLGCADLHSAGDARPSRSDWHAAQRVAEQRQRISRLREHVHVHVGVQSTMALEGHGELASRASSSCAAARGRELRADRRHALVKALMHHFLTQLAELRPELNNLEFGGQSQPGLCISPAPPCSRPSWLQPGSQCVSVLVFVRSSP